MAIIPRSIRPGVSTAGVGAPQVNPSVELGDGAVAQGLGALGASITRIGEEERRRNDETHVLAGTTELRRLRNDFTHGEGGALRARGPSVFDVVERRKSDFEKEIARISGGLANERQQQAFDAFAQRETLAFDLDVERHAADETARYADDTRARAIDASFESVENAVAAGLVSLRADGGVNDVAVQKEAGLAIQAIRTFGARYPERLPMPQGEWIAEMTKQAVSGVHERVIGGLLTRGDDETASAYLAKHGEGIDGDVRVRFARDVGRATEAGETQRAIDGLVRSTFDSEDARDPVGGRTIAEMERDALTRADTITDVDRRRAVRGGVKAAFAERRDLLERERRETLASLAGRLDAGASLLDVEKDSRLSLLDPDRQQALRKRAAHLQSGAPEATNEVRYAELQRAAVLDEEAFLGVDLVAEWVSGNLTTQDRRALEKIQLDLFGERRNGGVTGPELKSLRTQRQAIESVFRETDVEALFGLERDDSDDDDALKLLESQLFRAMEARDLEMQEHSGRRMTNVELEDAARELLVGRVVTDRGHTVGKTIGSIFGLSRFSDPVNERAVIDLTPDDIVLRARDDDGDRLLLTPNEVFRAELNFQRVFGRAPATDVKLRRYVLGEIQAGRFSPSGQ